MRNGAPETPKCYARIGLGSDMPLDNRVKRLLTEERLADMIAHAATKAGKTSHESVLIPCPRCLRPLATTEGEDLSCSNCGFALAAPIGGFFGEISAESAHLGHVYRQVYERSDSDIHYFIEADSALAYLAGLIVGGIVGGIAYDGFKKLVIKAAKLLNIKIASQKAIRKEVEAMDDKTLKEFFGHVREYYAWRTGTSTSELDPRFTQIEERLAGSPGHDSPSTSARKLETALQSVRATAAKAEQEKPGEV